MRNRAFTLVEILVVIGVIAVLIGILLPVLSQVRAKAREITCASNLSQIDRALQMYANDFAGAPFPPRWEPPHWWTVVPGLEESYATPHPQYPILDEVHIQCPETGIVMKEVGELGEINVSLFSYVFNGHLESIGTKRSDGHIRDIAASNIVLMGELKDG